MEGGLDVEERTSQDGPGLDAGSHAAEENKFQKAIGAWRSAHLTWTLRSN
jgi:homeobox protein cut-like